MTEKPILNIADVPLVDRGHGETFQVRWGRLTYASAFFSHDYPAARAAVARLATLDVETIALAHYGLWRRDAHACLRALAAAAG